jgi:hypothetical protein
VVDADGDGTQELLVAGRTYVRGADLRNGEGVEHDGTPGLAAAVAASAVVEPAGVTS